MSSLVTDPTKLFLGDSIVSEKERYPVTETTLVTWCLAHMDALERWHDQNHSFIISRGEEGAFDELFQAVLPYVLLETYPDKLTAANVSDVVMDYVSRLKQEPLFRSYPGFCKELRELAQCTEAEYISHLDNNKKTFDATGLPEWRIPWEPDRSLYILPGGGYTVLTTVNGEMQHICERGYMAPEVHTALCLAIEKEPCPVPDYPSICQQFRQLFEYTSEVTVRFGVDSVHRPEHGFFIFLDCPTKKRIEAITITCIPETGMLALNSNQWGAVQTEWTNHHRNPNGTYFIRSRPSLSWKNIPVGNDVRVPDVILQEIKEFVLWLFEL